MAFLYGRTGRLTAKNGGVLARAVKAFPSLVLKACDLDNAAALGTPREPKATPYICAPELARHLRGAPGPPLLADEAEDTWALGVLAFCPGPPGALKRLRRLP